MSDFLWVEKYRPKTIEECILPANTKKTFSSFLKKGEVPNLLLAGPAGCGKTTVAKALCHELGADFYVINGSDEGRFLDTVRNQAKNFASTVSLMGGAKHKVIIIDEADNTTHDVQLLLRANIEEFYGNCRFIFTCNYKNKIIEPLHSRCAVVDFSIKGKEKQEIAVEFFKRLNIILDEQRVEYDKKVIVELINKHFPDWRRVLNECQRYSASGKIDTGILATFTDVSINDLTKNLKEKNFPPFVNGVSITWTMSLLFCCGVYTMLFIAPLKTLVSLLLFSLLLGISIKLPLLRIKKSIFSLLSRK